MDPSTTGAPKHHSAPSTQPDNVDTTSNRAILEHSRDERNHRGWRRIALNFTPSWFSVNMGTGIVSILLHNLPYNATWIYWLSVIIFALNVFLFVLFLFISIVRYTMFPGVWSCMINHPVQSLFVGTFPMGLATIINMIVLVCVPAWGSWAAYLAWGLWWFDIAVAVSTNVWLPFLIMYNHKAKMSTMTATWLLPIIATIVASASGAIVASVLPLEQALITMVVSYILLGLGLPTAMVTLVIYFQRLTMDAIPPREVIVSVFLPLGPLGQGSYASMKLGAQALRILGPVGSIPAAPLAGQIFYTVGIMVAFILWGFALVWLFFAVASITRSKFPFNLGWWGFTFPLGVFGTATDTFATELPSAFFRVLGTIVSLVVVILWLVVSYGTIHQAFFGNLVFSPCVTQWEAKRADHKDERTTKDHSIHMS